MSNKNNLYTPVPTYRGFVENQVLTEKQLNEVIDYLDYQDRLSRVLLSGVGIVCGLQVSLNKADLTIALAEGAAVTTAGNLLKAEKKIFKGFTNFGDELALYPRFQDQEPPFTLYELREDLEDSDVFPLGEFEFQNGRNLEEMVALLYLESYPEEKKDCSPLDCDTQGQRMVENLRVLLIDATTARKLSDSDPKLAPLGINNSESLSGILRSYFAKRAILNAENTTSYSLFSEAYKPNFGALLNKVKSIYSLGLFGNQNFREIEKKLDTVAKNQKYDQLQYRYDFYLDLVEAYNELVRDLKNYFSVCCPNPEAFPKHILLGHLGHAGSVPNFRHSFYPSPAHAHLDIEKLKKKFARLVLMIETYNDELAKKGVLKVIPSPSEKAPIGNRAIPFYYPLKEDNSRSKPFYDTWKDGEFSLNYYGFEQPEEIEDPLDVQLKNTDFYRIEGHVGQSVLEVHKQLDALRKKKALPFDVLPIAVGLSADVATLDYDKYRAQFEDLQVILQAWNKELECMFKEATQFLSGFDTQEIGKHKLYDLGSLVVSEGLRDGLGKNVVEYTDLQGVKTPLFGATTRVQQTLDFGVAGTPLQKYLPVGTFKTSPVFEYLNPEEDSLGKLIGNFSDNLSTKEKTFLDVKNELGNLAGSNLILVEAAIDLPLELWGFLKETNDVRLEQIEDFTEENLEKYIRSLQAQCKKAGDAKKRLALLVHEEESELKDRSWLPDYRSVVDKITNSCCFVEKLKTLYQEIINRKERLLEEMVLHKFIKNHPGAEHKAGVEKGGTFVVLYYSDEGRKTLRPALDLNLKELNKVELVNSLDYVKSLGLIKLNDFSETIVNRLVGEAKTTEPLLFVHQAIAEGAISQKQPIDEIAGVFQSIDQVKTASSKILQTKDWWKLTGPLPKVPPKIDPDLVRIPDISRIPGAIVPPIIPKIPALPKLPTKTDVPSNGTVIGDLCLPYICCAGGQVTAFVFPEQLASLHLSDDAVCVGKEGADKIKLNVLPQGATVRAFVDEEELKTVFMDNPYFLDPDKIEEKYIGKEIRFEVNGQKADTVLAIHRYPYPQFSYENTIKDSTLTLYLYNNTDFSDEFSFEWEIGGKSIGYQAEREFVYTTEIDPESDQEFSVRLTARSGRCQNSVEEILELDIPEEDHRGCYDEEFFDCWRPTEQILVQLFNWRDMVLEPGENSYETNIKLLLDSLNRSNGFYKSELECLVEFLANNKQENEMLPRLFECLEIEFTEGAEFSFYVDRMLEYQKENCGEPEEDIKMLKRVGGMVVAKVPDGAEFQVEIEILPNGPVVKTDPNFGFSLNCIRVGQKIKVKAPGYKEVEVSVEKENLGPIELTASRQDPNPADPVKNLQLRLEWMDLQSLEALITVREMEAETMAVKRVLQASLKESSEGERLSAQELETLTNKTLKFILRDHQVPFNIRANKAELLDQVKSRVRDTVVNTDKLEIRELEKLLINRGIGLPEEEMKREYLKALESDGKGLDLQEEELTALSKPSLVNLANAMDVEFPSNATKEELIQRIKVRN